jgi:predicted nucleotidyltransferase
MEERGLYQKRLKKANLICRILSAIPFIRMIALTGSLAKGEVKPHSDIDFFIVTKEGRIWTSRFLTVFLLKILGQYRTDKKIAGKICPNRWQTEDSLKIYPQNSYHAREYSQIVPLFEIDEVYKKFQKANQWTFEKLKTQNLNLKTTTKNLKLNNNFLGLIRKMGEEILSGGLGDFLEEKLKNYQKKRILWDKRTYQEKARIIISDQILCFHPEGR